jgi:hypothetical protein
MKGSKWMYNYDDEIVCIPVNALKKKTESRNNILLNAECHPHATCMMFLLDPSPQKYSNRRSPKDECKQAYAEMQGSTDYLDST